VARHRREFAVGNIARELAQRGLILGVGERIDGSKLAAQCGERRRSRGELAGVPSVKRAGYPGE
jgi:hypothetical protein